MMRNPLPWKVLVDHEDRDSLKIADANGNFLDYSENYEAAIRFAVRAVNSHAELVRALETCRAKFEEIRYDGWTEGTDEKDSTMRQCSYMVDMIDAKLAGVESEKMATGR